MGYDVAVPQEQAKMSDGSSAQDPRTLQAPDTVSQKGIGYRSPVQAVADCVGQSPEVCEAKRRRLTAESLSVLVQSADLLRHATSKLDVVHEVNLVVD